VARDTGEFEIIDKPLNNKKFAYAKLIQLIRPSGQRQLPACPYIGLEENACTGCPWMIADYTSQLEQKRNRFVYAMKRTGFDETQFTIGPVHPAPQLYGYRNRCQVKTDGAKLGFVSENSHQIAPINDCMVLNDPCRDLLKTAIRQLYLTPPGKTIPGKTGISSNWMMTCKRMKSASTGNAPSSKAIHGKMTGCKPGCGKNSHKILIRVKWWNYFAARETSHKSSPNRTVPQ
jgi:hypothetical protein